MIASKNSARFRKKSKVHEGSDFTLTNTTKGRVPSLPFSRIKKRILPPPYQLSLVIVGDKRARTLNMRYRRKTYIPNVLSFPLDKNEGEVFLDLGQARRELGKRGESEDYFVALLFIHALLHLKGDRHGSTMEKREAKFLREFRIVNTAKIR